MSGHWTLQKETWILKAHAAPYNETDYIRYVMGELTMSRRDEFEKHCSNCPHCGAGVADAKRRIAEDREKMIQKSLDYMTVLRKRKKTGIMEVAVKITGAVMEALSATGCLVRASMPVPTRGSQKEGEKPGPSSHHTGFRGPAGIFRIGI